MSLPTRRVFSDAALQASVDNVLRTIPADKSGAVVAYVDATKSTGGAGLAVMARLGDKWSLVGALDKRWAGTLKAEAEVRFVW